MRLRVLVTAALCLVVAGCGSTGPSGEVGGASPGPAFPVSIGHVKIEREPRRIVSLSPTATEMLYAIDAGKQVVAVDQLSNYPAVAPQTKLSGYDPNVESVARYRPDLVVASADTNGLGRGLKALHIPLLVEPAVKDLKGTYQQIKELGRATGHVGAAASEVREMKDHIHSIVSRAPRLDGVDYYHELDNTYYSVTDGTFIGQVYSLLGLHSIADAAGGNASGYPQLSAEYIVRADPDVIFLADTRCCGQTAQKVEKRPGWGQISAVRNHAIVELNDDVASRWGPRVVDLLRIVATRLEHLESKGALH